MFRRWYHRVPYHWRRYALIVIHAFDPYIAVFTTYLHRLFRMIACMTYEGAGLSEPEDFPPSNEPVTILGKQYDTNTELEALRSDVLSRIWMTYRRSFPQIADSGFTSDKGWGCMLRCGQMVLAEGMIRRHFSREWSWNAETTDESYLRILRLFEDHKAATYSLHMITQLGVDLGKSIGEWYGPNTVAQVTRKLVPYDEWNSFSVHVAMDNMVIIDEIKQSCLGSGDDRMWRPLLLFIPLRLGLSELNPIYVPGLKKCLSIPHSLGLIGGKPNHASYFIGFTGDEVVYLDPHTTQDSGSLGKKSDIVEQELDKSYHCTAAQRMPFLALDPSLALCFYCDTEKEYDDLCNRFRAELIDGESSPVFELCNTRPEYMKDTATFEGAEGLELCDHHIESDDDEEFEVLQ